MSFGICGPLTSCDRVLPFPGRPRLARRRRMMEWFQTWRWEVAYTTYFRFRPEREFQETDHILLAQATTWARGSGITPLAAYCGICGHEHRADHWQGGRGARTQHHLATPVPQGFSCFTSHILVFSWIQNVGGICSTSAAPLGIHGSIRAYFHPRQIFVVRQPDTR